MRNYLKQKEARGHLFSSRLFPDVQFFDNLTIPVDIFLFQVVKEAPPFTYQLYKRTLGVEIVAVLFKVLCKVVDPECEQRDLSFGRTRVGSCSAVFCEKLLFYFFSQVHANIV